MTSLSVKDTSTQLYILSVPVTWRVKMAAYWLGRSKQRASRHREQFTGKVKFSVVCEFTALSGDARDRDVAASVVLARLQALFERRGLVVARHWYERRSAGNATGQVHESYELYLQFS